MSRNETFCFGFWYTATFSLFGQPVCLKCDAKSLDPESFTQPELSLFQSPVARISNIYISFIKAFHGITRTQQQIDLLPTVSLHISMVEHCTGIPEIMGSNPV